LRLGALLRFPKGFEGHTQGQGDGSPGPAGLETPVDDAAKVLWGIANFPSKRGLGKVAIYEEFFEELAVHGFLLARGI
jgi:hypothetical protein